MSESEAPSLPPQFGMPSRTLVQESGGGDLLTFEGLLILPIGARINLDNLPGVPHVQLDAVRFESGHADAVVVGVRVWGTQGADPVLVLEVELSGPSGPSAPLSETSKSDVVEAAEQVTLEEDRPEDTDPDRSPDPSTA
jgi:hypothetical protein